MLAAVNAASRRLWRWPWASVDPRCARRFARFRPGRRNAVQPNKETFPQLWLRHFAELDAHNWHGGLRRPPPGKKARTSIDHSSSPLSPPAIQLSQGYGENNQKNGLNATQTIAASTGEQMGQLGREIGRRNLQIEPTLEIRPGYRLAAQVTKDLILRPLETRR
ncbi:MAG: TrbI/VirB10 family protein [Rhodomicrobium sp.]